jgi:hypothetical protein
MVAISLTPELARSEIARRSFVQFGIDEVVDQVGSFLRDAAIQRAQGDPDQEILLAGGCSGRAVVCGTSHELASLEEMWLVPEASAVGRDR